jgi:GT2 family glycosyltransferase
VPKDMSDLVSIVVINYNTFELTSQCLRSIIANTHGVPYEIILVDNGSKEREAIDFKSEFTSIHLLALKTNLGFAKGNNAGIDNSKGNYILLLNSDTILTDDSVTSLYKEMKQHENVAVASGRLTFPDGRIQSVCQRFPSIRVFLFEITRLQKLYRQPRKGKILLGSFFDHKTEIFPDWVWGTFMMIKRDAIGQLPSGKLNDEYFMYCEDTQWCMDFKNAGFRTMFTPKASVIHLVGGSSVNRLQLVRASLEKFLDKNYNPIHAWLLKLINRIYYYR